MPTTRQRTSYHHGDLRAALTQAGLEAARTGGPEAVVLREATRRAGVSANAAYRHFADRGALVGAVSHEVTVLMAAAMRRRRRASPGADAATRARDRLRAVGLGYIGFALDEPGWFATGFFGADRIGATAPDGQVPPAFLLLVEALDDLLAAGLLPADRREGAEWPCWSTVHGFAELATHGPLRDHPRRELDALAARTVDAIIDGLSA